MTFLRKLITFGFLLAGTAQLSGASPIRPRQADAPKLTDNDILQFALTLEHLESTFYQQGLQMFPPADFIALGLTQNDVDTLAALANTEKTHVTTLQSVLQKAGVTPFQPCTYNFGFTNAAGMVATARILEAVGISAYLGAAPLVTAKAILSAAASIVTVEARHQTFLRGALGVAGVPQAFDVAIGPRQIFTLASAFITSCPAGSALPLVAFPPLTVVGDTANIKAGSVMQMQGVAGAQDGMFCTFTAGEAGTLFAPLQGGACTVPQGLGGEVFVAISKSGTSLNDADVVAGPSVLSLS